MKVFMMTDIEGVAGVTSFETHTQSTSRYYDDCKRLLTAEINAAVDALVDSGAEDILVLDGHGQEGVWYADLHAEARLIHGRPLAPTWIDELEGCDLALFIGQHAMAGVQTGNLNHTQNSGRVDSYRLNGQAIGEIAQFGLVAGAYGVPIIFLSGDEAACREIEALIPGVTTAAVKRGLSRNSAISVSIPKAHQLIREGVAAAVERHRQSPVAPLVWEAPYELEIRYFQSDAADGLARRRDVERVDSQTIRVRSDDVLELIYT